LFPSGSGQFVFNCIESLLRTAAGSPFDLRITAIDNSPAAGVGAKLRECFPAVEVIERRARQGYAANHNGVMEGSTADYFLVCNDDLVFRAGSLERAVAFSRRSATRQSRNDRIPVLES